MNKALPLLYLSSPSLPVGAFAYSQALESAIDLGWLNNEHEIEAWLKDMVQFGLANLDIPLLRRFMDAWQSKDTKALNDWNDWLLASRETAELFKEETQIGRTYNRLLKDIDAKPWHTFVTPSFISQYSWACVYFNVPLIEAALGLLWSWLDNQILVACKVLPMGQAKAQKMMMKLMPTLDCSAQYGLSVSDENMGSMMNAQVIASCLHETQYSRLFRS
jgi:urease accessory protein